VYCPPVSCHNCKLPSDVQESTVHADVVSSHSVIAEAATSTDVPTTTFDLGFVFSSSDEEIELNPHDSTTAMFMRSKVTYFWFSTFALLCK